ncbi:hypothetical protein [Flavihumibacter sp. CACIAM 22H1]|uniref:hypothetical protein n=1 Tax=Flavihumibacter sp. CACIAM 22H1 TaxID=1812911 RepID=UPI0007A8740D|nr:hypothetical protein [Flavihumibacter sp. CACIAM 22H1]KYP13759.1 MAG: hypothetical protein A1D16_19000 [Flavihumibacter sp. CACIAM 22H1]
MPPARQPVPKLRFDKAGYYFTGLFLLAFLGFWKSYFSGFFNGTGSHHFYFHFHAVMMLTWLVLLIVQPLLIRYKKIKLHRAIGRFSYVVMPLLLISVLLVLNSGLKAIPQNEISFSTVIFPIRDFFLLIIAFTIAILYRHKIQIHARAMIITGIIFIEPALFRFLGKVVFEGMDPWGFFTGIFLILGLLMGLLFIERKQSSGRWLFPSLLVVDILVYALVVAQTDLSFMDPLIRWFARQPLT